MTGRGSLRPAARDGLTPVCDGRSRTGGEALFSGEAVRNNTGAANTQITGELAN